MVKLSKIQVKLSSDQLNDYGTTIYDNTKSRQHQKESAFAKNNIRNLKIPTINRRLEALQKSSR